MTLVALATPESADSPVLGFIQVATWNGEPVMWKLYVAPLARNHRLGARLVRTAIGLLPAGTASLRTEHIAANTKAAKFYEREGFVEDFIDGDIDSPTATVWRRLALVGG